MSSLARRSLKRWFVVRTLVVGALASGVGLVALPGLPVAAMPVSPGSAAVLAASLVVHANTNSVRYSPWIGGTGGNLFYLRPCTLTNPAAVQGVPSGVDVNHGSRIDRLQLTYFTGRVVRNAREQCLSVSAGGGGGRYAAFSLSPDEYIIRVDGHAGRTIDGIRFHTNWGRSSPWYGGRGGRYFSVSAPPGHGLMGLDVRAGRLVDGFSVLWARIQ